MSLNYRYLAELGRRLCAGSAPRALDYGCGAGQLVEFANAAGLNCIGVETFYEGGSYREDAREKGLLDTVIFELKDGRIPQADNSFDIIISNQVFEHIDDFTTPLQEIDRVLKPGGLFINAFPTRDVWREGHCGIPFAHWFPQRIEISKVLLHVIDAGLRLRLQYRRQIPLRNGPKTCWLGLISGRSIRATPMSGLRSAAILTSSCTMPTISLTV